MQSIPLRNYIFIFAALISGGTLGYHLIEGWSILDSAYMTVITLSTVGYGELRPLSPAGKLFTSVLILFGVGTLAYSVSRMTEILLERKLFYRRRLRMEISRMQDHVIVCGFGRMGQALCERLRSKGQPFVVIERDSEVCDETYRDHQVMIVHGDAIDDDVLRAAGVERARALAAVLPADADNLFVTLSARKINPKLTIATRTSDEKNEPKMIAAGADRVLNPFDSGGRIMMRQLLQPAITAFFDIIGDESTPDLALDEIQLPHGSPLAGIALAESPIRQKHDVIVVGIRQKSAGLVFNPPGELAPEAGDVLILLGQVPNLEAVARWAGAPNPQP